MTPKISNWQCALLIVNTIVPSAILGVPGITVQYSSQDAWISVMLASFAGIVTACLIGQGIQRLGGLTLFDWLDQRCGGAARFAAGLLLTYYYGTSLCIILREFINFIRENVLNSTPAYVLLIVTVLVTIYAVLQGLEVIARLNTIVFTFSMLSFGVLIFLVAQNVQVSLLLPITETPLSKIVQGSLVPFSWLSEGAVLLLLSPFLSHPSHPAKAGMAGVAIAGGILMLVVLLTVTVLGPKLVTSMVYPAFNVIGIIKVSALLERVDLMFISFWIFVMYTKLSIFLFATCHCFSKTFVIRQDKPFIWAIGILSLLISWTGWKKEIDLNYFSVYGSVPHLLIFNIILPLCLCIVFMLRSSFNKRLPN